MTTFLTLRLLSRKCSQSQSQNQKLPRIHHHGCGSADPDPDPNQNDMDPKHCLKQNNNIFSGCLNKRLTQDVHDFFRKIFFKNWI